jgi:Protein of unknown function (DUF433)
MGGQARIQGLRFPVATVVVMLAGGTGTGEILAGHPEADALKAARHDAATCSLTGVGVDALDSRVLEMGSVPWAAGGRSPAVPPGPG